jgi:uncharacterized protein YjbI with pentapeptide repeats
MSEQYKKLTTQKDVKDLIDQGARESDGLEYKGVDGQFKDADKKEIAKDVSAMANASGGVIIYGVKTSPSDKTLPLRPCGPIDPKNPDIFDQVINSSVRPPIVGLAKKLIPNHRPHFMVVDVPKSTDRPHQSLVDYKYYRRMGTENKPMDHDLIVMLFRQQQDVQRNRDEIQDFKRLNTDEGRIRIAGAIRRLARMNLTDIDFRGAELRKFSFRNNDIKSLVGSIFYDGGWGAAPSLEYVTLEDVDFASVNCSGVTFSAFNPFEGLDALPPPVRITNCAFQYADLRHTVFCGALLEWTEPPPETIYEVVDDPDGWHGLRQIEYPPFCGANLSGASFKQVLFKNADFRLAVNVLKADFSGARGLETCVFEDKERMEVLRMAGAESK